jgi:hypothetical protein
LKERYSINRFRPISAQNNNVTKEKNGTVSNSNELISSIFKLPKIKTGVFFSKIVHSLYKVYNFVCYQQLAIIMLQLP